MVPETFLLSSQHQGLDWKLDPATHWHHVYGVNLYIKLPHATETGDRLLPYASMAFQRLTYLLSFVL